MLHVSNNVEIDIAQHPVLKHKLNGACGCLLQAEGLKSKSFMKSMLDDMRKKGKVTSKPARGKSFGYILPANWLVLKEQAAKGAPLDTSPPKPRSGRV